VSAAKSHSFRKTSLFQLFVSHAFRGVSNIKRRFKQMVANISESCEGILLVLKVCGVFLKVEKNVGIWKDVLDKLNQG
jgi:hypothetical protein